jgi:hypothetical protein
MKKVLAATIGCIAVIALAITWPQLLLATVLPLITVVAAIAVFDMLRGDPRR